MKKYGYHRLRLATGEIVRGPVVIVCDSCRHMVGWHLLRGEEPMVEWVGGTFVETT